ncbi:D-alanyl-D-alanine carboxypeptidase/D-alanyl-D-alanine endopeptidase [Brevibacillus daliensis]|uniref:D-alanyl-D-alanine carboxypeptidase/D-alanyl-D-alanine endopeptidase n=1 Tax=Brevibacillus daliensis TaxID=2892995 RepID=UPI001E61CEE0|nr:D-alanyl-D-alanine carboxypeptidase/D-alanyl-D-alanine-endopeptidase [Brevibacillus daliensis]
MLELTQAKNPEQEDSWKIQIDKIVRNLEKKGTTIGILAKYLDRKTEQEYFYYHDADRLFTPASNTKILTVLCALLQLGEEYQFKTEISYSGILEADGTLQGDLYIKGYGDPSIHSGKPLQVHDGVSLDQIVNAVKQKNIRRISGNIIVDDSFFDHVRLGEGWGWDYESEYYSAQNSALSINRGVVQIEYRPGKEVGEAVEVMLSPRTKYVQLIPEAQTVASSEPNSFHIIRDRAKNIIRIKGNLPIDAEAGCEQITVEEPALYLGTLLLEKLLETGIAFSSECTVKAGCVQEANILIEECTSPSLKEIVKHLNKTSDNLYAEMLLKTMGARKNGKGSADAGIQVIRKTLDDLGVKGPYELKDGSGLTRYNKLSPKQISIVLEEMIKREEFISFLHSLPISGVDGTLENRLKNEDTIQSVQAKTGTLNAVSSLSGYATSVSGERMIFSIMINGYVGDTDDLKPIEDKIVTLLASSTLLSEQ